MTEPDVHWTSAAACRDDPRFTCDAPTPTDLEELQSVCRACPVQVRCDALALDVEAVWGMWAGQWSTRAASRRTAA